VPEVPLAPDVPLVLPNCLNTCPVVLL
jgi:hypothetical protein